MQRFVTSTRLEREVTATRACVGASRSKSAPRPRLELFYGHGPQRARRRAEAGQRRFAIHCRNLFGECKHATREFDCRGTIRIRIEQSNESGAAANEGNQARIAVRCDY